MFLTINPHKKSRKPTIPIVPVGVCRSIKLRILIATCILPIKATYNKELAKRLAYKNIRNKIKILSQSGPGMNLTNDSRRIVLGERKRYEIRNNIPAPMTIRSIKGQTKDDSLVSNLE